MSRSRYRLDKGDTIIGDISLDTPNRRTSMYGNHSSSSSRRHCHHHHPYRRSEYMLEEFKKFNPSRFYGDMKKSEDVEAWSLGMNKFFRLHSYSKNMKTKIDMFNIKGKENIW